MGYELKKENKMKEDNSNDVLIGLAIIFGGLGLAGIVTILLLRFVF